MNEPAPTLKLRCSKGHEYTGEAMTLAIEAKGALVRSVILCPFCVLQFAQTLETQVVP